MAPVPLNAPITVATSPVASIAKVAFQEPAEVTTRYSSKSLFVAVSARRVKPGPPSSTLGWALAIANKRAVVAVVVHALLSAVSELVVSCDAAQSSGAAARPLNS